MVDSKLQAFYFKTKLKYNFAHYRYNDRIVETPNVPGTYHFAQCVAQLQSDILERTEITGDVPKTELEPTAIAAEPIPMTVYRHTHLFCRRALTLNEITNIYICTLEDSIAPYILYIITDPSKTFQDVYNLKHVQDALAANVLPDVIQWGDYVQSILRGVTLLPGSTSAKFFRTYLWIYTAYALETIYMLRAHLSDTMYTATMRELAPEFGTVSKYIYNKDYVPTIELSDVPEIRYAQIKAYVEKIKKSTAYELPSAEDVPNVKFIELLYTHVDWALWTLLSMRYTVLYNYAKAKKIYKHVEDVPMPTELAESNFGEAALTDFKDETLKAHAVEKETPRPDEAESTPKSKKDFTEYNHLLDCGSGKFKTSKYEVEVLDVANETTATSELQDRYNAVASLAAMYTSTFTKQLREIKAYNSGYKDSGKVAGKLDRKNLYKHKFDNHIFYNNEYKQKESDLAIGIMLDASGSMCGNGIENGRLTMIILHETLRALGINHSIMDHTNYGRNYTTYVRVYQHFKGTKGYRSDKAYSLANITSRSGNCDSGALWYMEQALLKTPNKDKICLMFSDGEPTECTGSDLVNQVAHMERNGIVVIGIGIGFPAITQYYTKSANGNNLGQMFNIVAKILKEYILHKKE